MKVLSRLRNKTIRDWRLTMAYWHCD